MYCLCASVFRSVTYEPEGHGSTPSTNNMATNQSAPGL